METKSRERVNRKLLGRCRCREINKKLTWKNTSGIGGFLKSSLFDRIKYWLFCVPRHGPKVGTIRGDILYHPPIPHIPPTPSVFCWTTKNRRVSFSSCDCRCFGEHRGEGTATQQPSHSNFMILPIYVRLAVFNVCTCDRNTRFIYTLVKH